MLARTLLTAALVATASPQLLADDSLFRGAFWYVKCNSTKEADRLDCFNYLRGFHQGMLLTAKIHGVQSLYCAPAEVTTVQKAKIVVRHMERNPAEWHQPFALLVTFALMEAFPCKAQGK